MSPKLRGHEVDRESSLLLLSVNFQFLATKSIAYGIFFTFIADKWLADRMRGGGADRLCRLYGVNRGRGGTRGEAVRTARGGEWSGVAEGRLQGVRLARHEAGQRGLIGDDYFSLPHCLTVPPEAPWGTSACLVHLGDRWRSASAGSARQRPRSYRHGCIAESAALDAGVVSGGDLVSGSKSAISEIVNSQGRLSG